jgi:uncharacterized protein YjbI with pentapeptide repeats
MPKNFSKEQNLRNRSFKGEDLTDANFTDTDIRGADFSGANLSGANLSGTTAGLSPEFAVLLFIANSILLVASGLSAGYSGASLGHLFSASNLSFFDNWLNNCCPANYFQL